MVKPLTIVIFGTEKSGKSKTGNTILNIVSGFAFGGGISRNCNRNLTWREEREICVVDTPGDFDTDRTAKEIKQILKDMNGSDVVYLLCIPLGKRLSQDNDRLLEYITAIEKFIVFEKTKVIFTKAEHNETVDNPVIEALKKKNDHLNRCIGDKPWFMLNDEMTLKEKYKWTETLIQQLIKMDDNK